MSPLKKLTVPLVSAAAAALITAVPMSTVFSPASINAQNRPTSSYADDRAAIEDLQARYLFALDFHDPDLYVSTFTERRSRLRPQLQENVRAQRDTIFRIL